MAEPLAHQRANLARPTCGGSGGFRNWAAAGAGGGVRKGSGGGCPSPVKNDENGAFLNVFW